jgi:presenilin-like A22 family membrane protease
MHRRVAFGIGFTAVLFFLVQLGALALVPTFYEQGYQTVEDPTNPTNSLLYIGAILVATAVMLAAFKYELQWLVKGFITLAAGSLAWYVFSVFFSPLLAAIPAVGLAVLLIIYPEWYIIDAAGVLMGAGAAGLFGISFGLLPALVLLSILAVYDAISVYGTEHMLDLAAGVMDLNLPVILVIPTTLSYSLREDVSPVATDDNANASVSDNETHTHPNELAEHDAEAPSSIDETSTDDSHIRDAFFIGLGDAVMPTVLVASAAFFLPAELTPSLGIFGIPAMTLPALTAMIGTFIGLFVLMWLVVKGRAHAGLPLLNGGAIGGYLIGALLSGVPLIRALGL